MSDAKDVKRAIHTSTELFESGEYDRALTILDQAIKDCLDAGGDRLWTRTMCHHAAVIADFAGKPDLVKRYYEQSLAHNPGNPRALYGLARVSLERGEAELAKRYATKCHEAVLQSDNEEDRGLLELIARRWPELGERQVEE